MYEDGRGFYGRGGYDPMNGFVVVHHGGGHPLAWLLFFFLILALLVALVAWLVVRFLGSRAGGGLVAVTGPPVTDALELVRLRYARGEIDRNDFLRMSGDLGAPPAPEPEAPTLSS
jgi:uncharacterized membrane protein